ncbi:MAG: MSMEG_4193 family putative phosphomutase [Actinomycetota bacterium]|nr:MSMEG_4193 family putative phosphomutase [Actinomycetota bacterium]
MATVVLVRHGRTQANATGVLAGWSDGVLLDEHGQAQAAAVAQRLAGVTLAGIVASPLERTRQTADAIANAHDAGPLDIHLDEHVGECHYGEWTGKELKKLAKDPLWKAVQSHPSSVTFPGGESMTAMQQRATSAIRRWNEHFGEKSTYAVVSHGDVIKAILADALGTHLDLFQRICVDPCSISIIDYTKDRPFVVRSNDVGSDLSFLTRKPKRGKKGDAVVGGGAGHA